MYKRREGGGMLAGVQAVLKGIMVGGLAAAAAREDGRRAGYSAWKVPILQEVRKVDG